MNAKAIETAQPSHSSDLDSAHRLRVGILYIAQIVTCAGILLVLEFGDCQDCIKTSSKPFFAIVGLFTYSALLAFHCVKVPVNRWFAPVALVVYSILVVETALQGTACALCIAGAVLGVGLFAFECPKYPANFRAVFTAMLVLLSVVSVWARPILALEEAMVLRAVSGDGVLGVKYYEPDKVNVLVVTKSNCPYCDQFKRSYDGDLKGKFGDKIRVRYVPLKDSKHTLSKLPMIVIGESPSSSVVIEGLPPLEILRRVVGLRVQRL
jgi:hypothetical protein